MVRSLKRYVGGVFALLLACSSGRAPSSGARETWRFAIEETGGSVQDSYAQQFKQLVERRTNGRVEVIVYPYGTLGTSDHLLEQLANGTIDLTMSSPGHLGKLIPAVQAFLLHFTLSDVDSVNECALMDEAVRARLRALYRAKGLTFVDAFSEGDMVWSTRRAVRTPGDFAGLKMRVMTSPLLLAAYSAYGASPTPLPYAEVYSALQLGMIDGQVNPIFAIEEMSFYAVSDYLIFPKHASFITTVASTPGFLQRLSAEHRALLDEVVRTLHARIGEVQRRMNGERLLRIRQAKPSIQLVELGPEERAAFAAKAAPVRRRFLELAGESGAALLRALDAAVARCAR